MSSLAKQLQQLQIPGLNKDVTSVRHVSILFDKKTAASLDIESIYNVGLAGFEQMVSIEPCLMDYQEQLFSQNAIHLQRVMEDKRFNKKLQRVINEFLLLLSPYLQLQPAKKCLEWLLRRFEIHRFDFDALFQCLLPYHETQLFGRVIELIHLNDIDGSMWEHLIPKLKAGNGLNVKTLVRHCSENTSLLNFVYEMATKSTKLMRKEPRSGLELIFSFYARIVSGVIAESSSGLSEKLIPFLMPMVETGLSSGFKHFICASYMILTMLVSNNVFKEKARTGLLVHTIKSMQVEWYEYGLMCVLSIVLSGKIRPLSKKLLEPILSLDLKNFVHCLVQMQKKYEVNNFIQLILQLPCQYFHHGDALMVGNLTQELINSLELDDDMVKQSSLHLMKSFIERKPEENEEGNDEEYDEEIVIVLKLIATRFSAVFDECLGEKFKEHKEEESSLHRLKMLVNNCLAPGKSSMIESSDLPLVVCLNHPETELRRQAVEQLFEVYESGVHGEDDAFFEESIKQRLLDDDPVVVKQVLKHPKSIIDLLSKESISLVLTKLSERVDDTFNLSPLYMKILQDLDSSKVEDQNLFFSVLAQVFTAISTKHSKGILKFFQDDQYKLDHPILSGIKKTLSSVKKLKKESKIIEAYVGLINNVAARFDWEMFQHLWKYQNKLHHDHILKFLAYLILMINTKAGQFDLELVLRLNVHRTILVENELEGFLEKEPLDYMINIFVTGMKEDHTFRNSLTNMCYSYFLQMLITRLSENREDAELKRILFDWIVPNTMFFGKKHKKNQVFPLLAKQYFKSCFENGDEIRSFCLQICLEELISGNKVVTRNVQVGLSALSIMNIYLDEGQVSSITNNELGLHLALLSYPNQMVRQCVLGNAMQYSERLEVEFKRKKRKNPWYLIFKEIIERESEILMDSLYAERMFKSMLDIKIGLKSANAFEVLSKKEDKETKKRIESLQIIKDFLKKWPIPISARILEMIKFIEVDDDFLMNIKELEVGERDRGACALFHQQIILHIMDMENGRKSSEMAVNFIIKCLETHNWMIIKSVLEKLSRSFYQVLEGDHQFNMLKTLFDTIKLSGSIEISKQIRTTMKHLPAQTLHICSLLESFVDLFKKKVDVSTLKEATNDLEELLSYVHEQDMNGNENNLVTSLFSVLDRCMKVSETEFVKQLCFSIIHKITKKENIATTLKFHSFNINTMLDCLKMSNDLQTQENCLLSIASTTSLFPVQILHSVMYVFSFMGGSMLRLDNEHSFGVIEKTIHTILPAILKIRKEGTRKRVSESSVEEIVMEVIQTFVNACPHCPEHRREFILQELLKAVDVNEHLSSTMLLMLKKISADVDSSHTGIVTTTTDVPMEEEETKYAPLSLDFCLHFFSLYGVHEQMSCIQQIVKFLMQLSKESNDTKKRRKQQTSISLIFDIHKEGESKSHLFTYTVISFITLALKNQAFSKMHTMEEREQQQDGSYLELTEVLIHYADFLNLNSKDTSAGPLNQKFQSKLLNKICHLLDTTLQSVNFTSYVNILAGLLEKNEHVLKLKGLELLAKLLQNSGEHVDKEQETCLLQLFPILNSNLETKKKTDPNITQLLLFCLRLLVVKLCRNHPKVFLPLVPVTHRLYGNEKTDEMVSINAMLLGAELVTYLKVQVLSDIGELVQPLLTKLSGYLDSAENKDALLLTTCLSCLQKMFVSIPQFMSPYISTVIAKVAETEMDLDSYSGKDVERIERIIGHLKIDIAKKIAPRLLLPILNDLTTSVNIDNVKILMTVSDIYGTCLEGMSSTDINDVFKANNVSLFKDLLDKPAKFDVPCIDNVEESTIEAFSKLTLKMTEKSLRHTYTELFIWATSEDALVTRRILTFFRLSISMATTLQGLFLLFVHDTLEKASEILLHMIAGKSDVLNQEVLKSIVDCCASIFHYDTHGFVNKDRFQMVVKPLVEQMETNVFDEDTFEEFVEDHLQPCLVNLASAVNDVTCWKTMNHLLLGKTKSDKAKVRLAVLSVIEKIYDKLGESYMVLIPETIPFLSEVLEDESTEVEQKCRQVIKQIESITGESMQKYF